MLLNRVLRRIADMLTRLESVAVKCTRSFTDVCVEAFAAYGFALSGYSAELYAKIPQSEENESLQDEGDAAHRIDPSGAPAPTTGQPQPRICALPAKSLRH